MTFLKSSPITKFSSIKTPLGSRFAPTQSLIFLQTWVDKELGWKFFRWKYTYVACFSFNWHWHSRLSVIIHHKTHWSVITDDHDANFKWYLLAWLFLVFHAHHPLRTSYLESKNPLPKFHTVQKSEKKCRLRKMIFRETFEFSL